MNKLRCNVCLIFGGGSGIGRAIAKRLVEAGAKVIIAGRTLSKLEAVKNEINSNNVSIIQWDILNINCFEENIMTLTRKVGYIDGFINCAGVSGGNVTGRGYEPWDITEEEWDTLSDINFKSYYFLLRNEINYLIKEKIKGNILNFSSNAFCMDITGAYGASKLAIQRWTRAFGKKYGKNGIIINGIAPGATFTPMIGYYAKDINEPYDRNAIGRFIKPKEIAELSMYLLSEYGEIICGSTIVADGGDNCAI